MKINALTAKNTYQKGNQNSHFQIKENNSPINYSYKNFAYPKNYYISFQSSRKNYDEFIECYRNKTPLTVVNFIDAQKYLRTEDEFNEIKNAGFIAFHTMAFEPLKNCKTVQDIKQAFPDEPLFQNLKTLSEVYKKTDSLFYQLRLLEENGTKVLNSDEDVTTFIVKKFLLECKLYKDVFDEFVEALTPEAKEGECGELIERISEARKSDSSLYRQLGIVVPNGREYAASVRYTNPDYKINRKKYFSTLSPDETNNKIKSLLESSDAKARYSMIDAWNQCVEIREKLSEFMTECMNNFQYYSSQISSLENLTVYDVESYSKLRNIMIAFWNKNPQYKEQLGEEISKAIARYNQVSYLGEEELRKYVDEIKKKSAEIKKEIQINKKKNKYIKHPNAIALLSIVAKRANNIFGYKTDSVIQDFAKMLINNTTEEELIALESDKNSKAFNQIFPEGIRAKMKEIKETPEFANISNAHHLALLEEAVGSGISENEAEKLIRDSKISIKDTTQEIVAGYMNGQIDFSSVESSYNRFRAPLSKKEVLQVANELTSNSGLQFSELEKQYLEDLINTQGAYSKLVLSENKLKNLVKILILNLYDKTYGTNHTQEIIKRQNIDKVLFDATKNINDYNLSDISFSW